jgi:hypothetical protein
MQPAQASPPELVQVRQFLRLRASDLERLDGYRDRNGLSRSAAIRQAVAVGLDVLDRPHSAA